MTLPLQLRPILRIGLLIAGLWPVALTALVVWLGLDQSTKEFIFARVPFFDRPSQGFPSETAIIFLVAVVLNIFGVYYSAWDLRKTVFEAARTGVIEAKTDESSEALRAEETKQAALQEDLRAIQARSAREEPPTQLTAESTLEPQYSPKNSEDLRHHLEEIYKQSDSISALELTGQPTGGLGTLDDFRRYIALGGLRLVAGRVMTNRAKDIVVSSLQDFLVNYHSDLLAQDGALGDQEKLAKCIRYIEIFLRCITYAVMTGNQQVLDEKRLDELRETYQSLDVTTDPMRAAVASLRQHTLDTVFPEVEQFVEMDSAACSSGSGNNLVLELCSELEAYFDTYSNAL